MADDLVEQLNYEEDPYRFGFLTVRWRPFGVHENEVEGIDQRSLQMAYLFQYYVDQFEQNYGDAYCSVLISHRDHLDVMPLRRDFDVQRGYRQFDLNEFLGNLDNSLQNLTNSAQDLELDDLVFELKMMVVVPILAGAKIATIANKALRLCRPDLGLYADNLPKKMRNMCGWYALLQAIVFNKQVKDAWIGDLKWLTLTPRMFKDNKKLCAQQARNLMLQFGAKEPLWVIQPVEGLSTIQQIVERQPKLNIVLLDRNTKMLLFRACGKDWVWKTEATATIYLDFEMNFDGRNSVGHLRLVRNILQYYNLHCPVDAAYMWCDTCLHVHTKIHQCGGRRFGCSGCGREFMDADLLYNHTNTGSARDRRECPYCNIECFSQECLDMHRCRQSKYNFCDTCNQNLSMRPMAEHVCDQYVCKTCEEFVDVGHTCYISKPAEIKECASDAEIYGQQFYVFDVESAFYQDAKQPSLNRHVVNYICVRQCFTDNQWDFKTLGEFLVWVFKVEEPCTMFAHNFKGYDGRMVYEEIVKRNGNITKILKRGSKFLQFQYGNVTFQDTLLHIPASLEQLPKMFSMDTTEFKKGFFPYEFNTPQNQEYVGVIPDKKYFQPQMMKENKNKEFHAWYAEQEGTVYNFRKELEEYCQSDVKILAKTVETYFLSCLKNNVLDPWSCLTIASYALKVYREYHMPMNTIAIESEEICRLLKPALHGGRVDVRRMLKEWSPQELDAGIHGRYQDVQSLYPTVQFYDAMPIGPGRLTEYKVSDPIPDLTGFFGFVCCDIKPTRYMFHPVLVELKDGKLQADLHPKTKITITSAELHAAVANHYVVTRVYHTIEYNQSTDLFKSYFRTHLKSKIESSGMPDWVHTDADWQEFSGQLLQRLGIEVKREDMLKNNSKKTVDKLLCNSLWGKFAETAKGTTSVKFDLTADLSEFMAFQQLWLDRKLVVTQYRRTPDNTSIIVDYHDTSMNLTPQRRQRIWLAGAAFVTACGRLRLWEMANKLGERVLYHDTDSIIYEYNPQQYNIPEGRYLGEWECETAGVPITKFVSIGPKCYAYVLQNGKQACKVKGITLNTHNNEIVNFESMKQMVLKQKNSVTTKNLLFKYNTGIGAEAGGMLTGVIDKIVRVTYSKGVVAPTTLIVYPKGADVLNPSVCQNLELWSTTDLTARQ